MIYIIVKFHLVVENFCLFGVLSRFHVKRFDGSHKIRVTVYQLEERKLLTDYIIILTCVLICENSPF